MITSPFPASISFSSTIIASVNLSDLLPEERHFLSPRAVEKRQLDFTAGRVAARHALVAQGLPKDTAITRNEDRSPCWPPSYVGSISHAKDWAVACAAKASSIRAVGLDLEHIKQASNISILPRVASATEQEWIVSDGVEDYKKTIMLFSAKESFYKMLYPLVQQFFGFSAVELEYREEQRTFLVQIQDQLLKDFKGLELTIRVDTYSDYILTSCFLER